MLTRTTKDLKPLLDGILRRPLNRAQLQRMRERGHIGKPKDLYERSAASITFRDLIGVYFSSKLSEYGFGVEEADAVVKLLYNELETALKTKEITVQKINGNRDSVLKLKCFIQDRRFVSFGPANNKIDLFVRHAEKGEPSKSGYKFVDDVLGLDFGRTVTELAKRWDELS